MEFEHSLFGRSFSSVFSDLEESVLDFPSGNELSSEIWKKENGKYILSDEAEKKAADIIDWAISEFNLKDAKASIVGSIGSNTFNDSSDIDIHITDKSITKENSDNLNKELMTKFKKKFVDTEAGKVGKHPFEVYFQSNIHQDEMSVGCYDFFNKEWSSGPEILPKEFNPYEEYYDGVQEHLSDMSDDIRLHILKCGEIASVITKIEGHVGKDDGFLKRMEKELRECTKRSREMFNDIRKKRSIASEPKSKSDAIEKRDSKEWKIADSSFKFLDKLGYIAAILSIAKAGEEEGIKTNELCEKVISSIHDNLFNKDRTGYADIDKN